MWRLLEPIHAATYFAPPSVEALKATGLKGFWMCYFAARAAPLGAVDAPIVESTFYNFAPWLVRRAIPDAWSFAPPSDVLAARWSGVSATLAPHAGSLGGDGIARATQLLATAGEDLACEGRTLAAANASVALPEDPIAAMWQRVTTLREHRGDGHVAALVCAGLTGLEAHLTLVGTGTLPREVLQPARGFTDDEWDDATRALTARGVLDGTGRLTDEGRTLRRDVEQVTDRAALAPWARLGEAGCDELEAILGPMSASVVEAGVVPALNPMGLPPR